MKTVKETTKTKKLPTTKIRGWKYNHQQAWDAQSQYLRRRAANFQGLAQCYTCKKWKPWKELEAGHFKHGVLDFDLMNIHPQCTNCNKWNSGQRDLYAQYLIEDYGTKAFLALCKRASEALKGELYTIEQLKQIRDKYRELLKHL